MMLEKSNMLHHKQDFGKIIEQEDFEM